MPSTPAAITASKNSATRPGSAPSKSVQLMLTRKPRAFADDAGRDLLDLAVEQRLAAGDRHDGRAALVHRLETGLDREALIKDRIGVVDLAATHAGEIAAEQRLEHEHQRIALDALEPLLGEIRADADLLT
jgi:hypothetical protein